MIKKARGQLTRPRKIVRQHNALKDMATRYITNARANDHGLIESKSRVKSFQDIERSTNHNATPLIKMPINKLRQNATLLDLFTRHPM